MNPAQPSQVVLAFLTVRPTSDDAVRGGYLLTTRHGRPIEFHYTADLRLRGPQRLLFGSRIEEFLEVDLLAMPLVERQSAAPNIIVVDRPALLELRTRIPAPVVLLEPSDAAEQPWAARAHPTCEGDYLEFRAILDLTPPNFDWLEPFERLGAALGEVRETRLAA